MEKVYIFGSEPLAETFRLLAYALDLAWELRRVGSAVVSSPEIYAEVMEKTSAIPASITAEIESIL